MAVLLYGGAAPVILAGAASPAGSQNAAQIEYINTADQIGIETEQMRIIFDRHSGTPDRPTKSGHAG